MKKTLILIMIVFLLAGCSSGNQTSSSSGNATTTAEDLEEVKNDLKETSEEIKDTLSDTFSEAFGDLLGNSQKEEENSSETVDVTEPAEEDEQEQAEEIEYIIATVDEMYEALNDNALKAKKTYDGQYVEVTGVLGTIDSNGSYICLDEMNTAYSFYSVQCFVKNDEQLDRVIEMSSGKKYTIRVKITTVGEVLGYSGDIIEFVD